MPAPSRPPEGPAAAMFEADGASRSAGMRLLAAGDGTATVQLTIGPAMVNGHANAHGGYVFMLADTAFACACNSRGQATVAAGADITFVAPARGGEAMILSPGSAPGAGLSARPLDPGALACELLTQGVSDSCLQRGYGHRAD